MKLPKLIGIDFDNTIVNYTHVLEKHASELGFAVHGLGKRAIRDAIRASIHGDLGWQKLQGLIYGPSMIEAQVMDGVNDFLTKCHYLGVRVKIVSHKSEYAGIDPSRTPLRQSAINWMSNKGFFTRYGIGIDDIHFCDTKAIKIERIKSLNVSVFIDDLEEILGDSNFPEGVRRILFAPEGALNQVPYEVFRSFKDIQRELFDA